jgi:glycosyltransferase involved in cell wall biosynthesis
VEGLERYTQAYILVRVDGRPAAWVRAAVEGGLVTDQAVLAALDRQAGKGFWQMVAELQLDEVMPSEDAPTACRLKASVAVCTRDRPEDLQRCLEGLHCMPQDGQEVLVIDSASRSGATRAAAAAFPDVRYVRMERPGLNIARNAAMAAASGDIVVFIDDDAVPDANWLRVHLRAFDHPLTMASMGCTLPLELETEAQEMFESFSPFNRGFVPRFFDHINTHPMAAAHAGAGVNMAVRKNAPFLVGPFNPALDAGTPTCSGGDTEMLARLIAAGYRVVYTPSALNWHRHRRTMPELRHTVYGYGVGTYACWTSLLLSNRETGIPVYAAVWLLREQIPNLLRSLLRRPDAHPWPLPWDELRGCLAGPWAYLRARRAAKVAQ